jgi:hypothetical protein
MYARSERDDGNINPRQSCYVDHFQDLRSHPPAGRFGGLQPPKNPFLAVAAAPPLPEEVFGEVSPLRKPTTA